VLLADYRGQGAGRAFFERRETHARALRRRFSCFCAVLRDADDPRRPTGHVPLDAFWQRLGYRPMDGVTTRFAWREVGANAEIDHAMQFWIKHL
jgi:GNAT superfamily N-acetyltransferase